jgi:DNA-binding IclR family transcriptional regulator
MESKSNNHALSVLEALRAGAGKDGEVHVDMHEVCRAAGLHEEDARESLADLEHEGFITTEIVCHIAEKWLRSSKRGRQHRPLLSQLCLATPNRVHLRPDLMACRLR